MVCILFLYQSPISSVRLIDYIKEVEAASGSEK